MDNLVLFLILEEFFEFLSIQFDAKGLLSIAIISMSLVFLNLQNFYQEEALDVCQWLVLHLMRCSRGFCLSVCLYDVLHLSVYAVG